MKLLLTFLPFFFSVIAAAQDDTLMHVNVNSDSLQSGGYIEGWGISYDKYLGNDPAATWVCIDKRTKQVFSGTCYKKENQNVILCQVFQGGTETKRSEWYMNGNRKTLNGKSGPVKSWYSNGALEMEYYADGKKGIRSEYYPDAKIRSKTVYKASGEHTHCKTIETWYESGTRQSAGKFHKEKRKKEKSWYENGKRQEKFRYRKTLLGKSKRVEKVYSEKHPLKKETYTISKAKMHDFTLITKTWTFREKGKLKLKRSKTGINTFP